MRLFELLSSDSDQEWMTFSQRHLVAMRYINAGRRDPFVEDILSSSGDSRQQGCRFESRLFSSFFFAQGPSIDSFVWHNGQYQLTISPSGITFFAVLLTPVLDGFEWLVKLLFHSPFAVIKSRQHQDKRKTLWNILEMPGIEPGAAGGEASMLSIVLCPPHHSGNFDQHWQRRRINFPEINCPTSRPILWYPCTPTSS